MTLSTKLALAFASSLFVTLSVVFGSQWAVHEIELEHARIRLSQQQLQSLDLLLARLYQHHDLLSQYAQNANAATLSEALHVGREAENIANRLLDQNRSEITSIAQDGNAEGDWSEEKLETNRLIDLQLAIHAFNEVVDKQLSNTQTVVDSSSIEPFLRAIVRADVNQLPPIIEELAASETEALKCRELRLEEIMDGVDRKTVLGAILGGVICIGAIYLLNASIRELNRSSQREQAANIAKSEFLANMSHEIRTPLNGILGFAQLLMRRSDLMRDVDVQQHLLTIHSSGQHLLQLINDILDLSKVEAGRLECRLQETSVLPIYEEVVSILRVKALSKSINLQFQWRGKVPVEIHSDAARLKQILLNLVGNAVKFTDAGGVCIEAEIAERYDGWILITKIIDTGVGISPEQLKLIFEPFRQADTSLTRGFEGTGLGLTISKRLAKLLGGDVTVASVVGEGSTFLLTIDPGPIDPTTLVDLETASRTLLEKPDTLRVQVSLSGRRILVVDDGKTNRDLIRIVLSNAGAEVLEAENGLIGVKMVVVNVLDAVLMDVQMPIMDGLTATRRLRQQGYEGPIIALTAHAMDGDRKSCLDAGCSGYLSKPINMDDLLNEVGRQLGVTTVSAMAQELASEAPERHLHVEPLCCSLPNEPAFLELAREFIADFEVRMRNMGQLRSVKDWDALADEAHWLKGAGGTAGFYALTAPAGRLEQAARMANSEECDIEMDILRDLNRTVPAEYLPASAGVA